MKKRIDLDICTNNNLTNAAEAEKLTTIFFRTVIIYVVLMFAMRLMGKRQIGELEVSDLITTLLVSEIASLPITDTNIPVSHAIIPIIILLTFEVGSSALLVSFPTIKKMISTRPATLIKDGKLSSKAMRTARISADELISELRQNNISDLSEVQYAILEQNGKISVIQKPEYRTPSVKDLRISVKDEGLYHIIIENSCINPHGASEVRMSKDDIISLLNGKGISIKDVYLMMISDSGDVQIVKKEKS